MRGEDSFDEITFSGLRGCDGKPNCFSTTGDFNLEDRIQFGVDTLIKPWTPPVDDSAPFKTLVQAIKAYPPGQGFVDGGGFQIVKETDNYIYAQFESKGYIDDAEWPYKDGVCQARGSRRASADFGVNGKRSTTLPAACSKGWTIEELTAKTHRDYFDCGGRCRPDLRPGPAARHRARGDAPRTRPGASAPSI